MKQTSALLYALAICLIFIPGCKKDKITINPDEVRLMGIDYQQSNGDVNHVTINYDASGRIDRVSSQTNNQTPGVFFTVTYSNDEAILIATPIDNADVAITDTIRLLMSGNRQVVSRTEYSFQEYKSPVNNPQRTYVYDTTLYEYDAAGLLKKETHGHQDTTWYNPGVAQTSITRTSGITNHTVAGGNLATINSTANSSTVTRQSGNTYLSASSSATTLSFEYTRAYANKTDFSNAVILNELNIFAGSPMNKSYSNLPEKWSGTTIEKDQNGTITSTNNYTIKRLLTFNSYGFVATMADAATPNIKTVFIYNK